MILRFFFMMVLITSMALTVSAQQREPVKTRSEFTPFVKIAPLQLPGRHYAGAVAAKRSLTKEWYNEGTLVDSGSKGKLYRMPVDNMLCLVPEGSGTAQMPVKRTRIPEKMPNAFSRRGRNSAGGEK